MLRYISWRSFIPLRNVLRQRRQWSFEHDLSPLLRWNFLRFSEPLNIFVHNTVFKCWNLGFPATAFVIFIGLLRLKKWSTEKKAPQERLPKGDRSRQVRKFTSAQIQILAKFYSITLCFATEKQGSFEQDSLRFLRWNFLRFAGLLNIFVPFLVPVDKKKKNS